MNVRTVGEEEPGAYLLSRHLRNWILREVAPNFGRNDGKDGKNYKSSTLQSWFTIRMVTLYTTAVRI